MKELVEVIARALVEKPDEVVVTEKKDGDHVTLELKVAGRIARAIRTVVKAASTKDDIYTDVDIVE